MANLLLIIIVFGITLNINAQQITINKDFAHQKIIKSAAYSPDGKFLAVASDVNTIIIWDLQKGKPIALLRHNGSVNCVTFNHEGNYLASCSNDSTIKLWSVESWKEIRTTPKDKSIIKSVAFSPDDKMLASGSYQTIKLWNVKTLKEIRNFNGHTSFVNSLSFSSNGTYLASGSDDNNIKLWDLKTKEEIRTFEGHTNWVNSLSFSPDGRYLASGSADKTVMLWDIQSRKKNIPIQKNSGVVHAVTFSPNGKYLAWCVSDKKIKLWDIHTEKNIRTWSSNAGINSFTISPDGKNLVSGNDDGSVILWELPTGKRLATFMLLSSDLKDWIVYTPNGKYDGHNCDKYLLHASDLSSNELSTIDNNYFPGLLSEILGYKQLAFEKEPPSIILDSDTMIEVSQKEHTISGSATDESGVLLVSVNGIKANGGDDYFNCPVTLNNGVNKFQVLAYDRLGNMGKTNITITYKPSLRKDYALIFYESDYTGSNLPNLKGTKKNADSLAYILQNRYGFETYVFANYTASQIENTLDKYAKKGYLANDQLLIYFTGHGQKGIADTTGFLLCANNTRMTHREFNTWSGIDSCKHILMVLDACYSGLGLSINMIGDSPPEYNPRTRDEYLKELFKFKPARKALTSGEGKVSIPFNGLSEFSEALIFALRNNQGKLFNILTYNELKASIVSKYPKIETGKFSNEDEADGTFIFIKK